MPVSSLGSKNSSPRLRRTTGKPPSRLTDTLDLSRGCHAAYLEANDTTRRLFNQAFFAKIYIDEDDETRERTVRVDYNAPFDNLLSRLVPGRVHHELDTEQTAHRESPVGGSAACISGIGEGQGSHTDQVVVLRCLYSNPADLVRQLEALVGLET